MNKEEYISTILDPNSWFKHAFGQKLVADKLLHNVIITHEVLDPIRYHSDTSDYVVLWSNALFHYALGIENGLKGIIVKKQPSLVHYEVRDNDVILHDIGGQAGRRHDLYSLCNVAGLLNKEGEFKLGGKTFRNVLQSLSDMIKWSARYPVPTVSSKRYVLDKNIPPVVVYGFHIIDVIEPLFEIFKKFVSIR